MFTFFVLFSAITVNVSAQFPYNLDLDNSGENAVFETQNVDNPNYTFFYAFVEDPNDCTSDSIPSSSQNDFDPNDSIDVSSGSVHNKFLCVTENNGIVEYQPVAPLYIVNQNPVLTVSKKRPTSTFGDVKNTYNFIVNDDLDYNDRETGRLVWGYVPFPEVCDSSEPKDVASLFGLDVEGHEKPTYEKYDEKYGKDFVVKFFDEQGNLQDITDKEGGTFKIKIQNKKFFLSGRTAAANNLCFLSAHPSYDAYAVKGVIINYDDEGDRSDGGTSSVNQSTAATLSQFLSSKFSKDPKESNFRNRNITDSDFFQIEDEQIVPCGNGDNLNNKCKVTDFIKLSSNIFKYLAFYLFIPLATFGVLFSGLKFLFFAESAEARNAAKNNLIWTVVAFILVFGAYVLVDYFFVLTGVGELNELIKNNI